VLHNPLINFRDFCQRDWLAEEHSQPALYPTLKSRGFYGAVYNPTFLGSTITYLKLEDIRSELEARWVVNITHTVI
ncbi:MAG: hypothetical protein AB1589_15335, partial [Cyanobacteriota bacterium]